MSSRAVAAGPSLKDLAAATPDSRDRYVDLLRAFSIAVVVFGHWLMAIVFYDNGNVSGESALDAIPGMWILTWLLQVMPLFFFVGGFSNLTSIEAARRKGQSTRTFVRSRVERLMKPTVVFISTWLVVAFVLEQTFGLGDALRHATALIAKPVWFLAVYLLVVALAPRMLDLHKRFRWTVPAVMVAGAIVVDITRIAFDVELLGYLNFAFVWLFAHQLGFFYADGTLPAKSRRFFVVAAALGLGALVALTNIGVYTRSMVGVADQYVSNNDPPSICLIALTTWLVSLAMLLRGPITRWLATPRNWAAVIAANSMIMTVFLWHLTALLIAVVVAYPLGFPQYAGGTLGWWLTRPAWIAILCLALVPLVYAFSRFERPRFKTGASPAPQLPIAVTVVGIALLIIGMAGFAQGGFAGVLEPTGTDLGLFEANPLLSAFHMALGVALLRTGSRVAVAFASAALVGVGALEAFPLAGDLLSVIPITTGNTVLHLACGTALSVFGRTDEARRTN
ncbi:MAG: acyltransferase family protein [Actinomycetota bacterium]